MESNSMQDSDRPERVPSDEELSDLFARFGLVARSRGMMAGLRQAWKAARVSDAALLIYGETGTGKQVLAQAVHCLDEKRSRHPFVTVHCGTIQESLAESELFGHNRGAFSGAIGDRKGLFQTAHQGTLFLDDVNDLPLALQPKLLDVLQRGIVRSVGADHEKRLDVRIIAACNHPLKPLVKQNRFRADLYYRLDVIHLTLPALRDRPDDFPHLLLATAKRHAHLYAPIDSVEPALLAHLVTLSFPGNIRELEHAVERMLFNKTSGCALTLADWLSQEEAESSPGSSDSLTRAATTLWQRINSRGDSYSQVLAAFEKRFLEVALAAGGRTRRELAAMLRISERKLYDKLRVCRAPEETACPTADLLSQTAESRSVSQTLSGKAEAARQTFRAS